MTISSAREAELRRLIGGDAWRLVEERGFSHLLPHDLRDALALLDEARAAHQESRSEYAKLVHDGLVTSKEWLREVAHLRGNIDAAHAALDALGATRTDSGPDGCMGDDAEAWLSLVGRIEVLGAREKELRAAARALVDALPKCSAYGPGGPETKCGKLAITTHGCADHPLGWRHGHVEAAEALVALLGEKS